MKLPTTYSTQPSPKLNKQYYFANINEALYVLLWIRSCYIFEWTPVWNSEIYKINMIQNSFIWTKHFERILLSHSQIKWRRLTVHFHWLAKNLNSHIRNSILNLQKLTNKKPTRCHLLFYCTSYRLNMFWTLLCSSSGARDYNVDYHIGRFVLGLLYVGG